MSFFTSLCSLDVSCFNIKKKEPNVLFLLGSFDSVVLTSLHQ